MTRDVAIVGIGMTKFGEHWNKGLRELIMEAGIKSVEDAGISGKDIELIIGGSMSSGIFAGQDHTGALFTDYLGLNPIPSIRTEAACASSSVALSTGIMAIQSGRYNCAVVGGVEKMTDVYGNMATTTLAGAMDRDNEANFGLTFPGVYALMAQRHMYQYGTTREQIAMVAVKNHANAMHNPNAQFHKKITVDDVLKSPLVSDPLRLLDCSPIADGAASVVIVPAENAKQYTDTPIYIRASSQASDTLGLYRRPDITTVNANIVASRDAYRQAGLTPKDMHFAEVHDCFTINEIIGIEDIGFTKKGEGGRFVQNGETQIGGKIPINTSGGLKAKGHPVGATGVAQVIEAVEQLRGEAGGRQVAGAENGLTHNVGGSGSTVVVHILSRNRK